MGADHSKQRGYLSSAFRRAALPVALAATLLTPAPLSLVGSGKVQAKTSYAEKLPDQKKQPAAAVKQPEKLSQHEKSRRAQVRETLLERARGNFEDIAGAETGYTAELEILSAQLTARLKGANGGVHDRVLFVDPAKLDAALSLGFAPGYAVALQLAEVPLPAEQLDLAGEKSVVPHTSRFGVETYTQAPTAITNLKNPKAQACIVVPSSEHALDINIPGLSRQEQVNFTNRHESWHCLDCRYNLRHLDPAAVAAVRKGTLAQHLKNPVALEIFTVLYKKEALADAGAVGDMIRKENARLSLIDRISDWRASDPQDLQHLSVPVLRGLREKINEIGLENFRKLSDAEAERIYMEVTDSHGMTRQSLETILRVAVAKPADRAGLAARAQRSEDGLKALEMLGYMLSPAANVPSQPPPDPRVATQLNGWDPHRLLDDEAFRQSRKITPETIIRAYAKLQEDLRGKMKAEPSNPLYPAQATKLQQAFLVHARALDFVAVNAERGVDIVKTEAELRRFAPPVKKPAAKQAQNGT